MNVHALQHATESLRLASLELDRLDADARLKANEAEGAQRAVEEWRGKVNALRAEVYAMMERG